MHRPVFIAGVAKGNQNARLICLQTNRIGGGRRQGVENGGTNLEIAVFGLVSPARGKGLQRGRTVWELKRNQDRRNSGHSQKRAVPTYVKFNIRVKPYEILKIADKP